jgi:hypothetical protein
MLLWGEPTCKSDNTAIFRLSHLAGHWCSFMFAFVVMKVDGSSQKAQKPNTNAIITNVENRILTFMPKVWFSWFSAVLI